MKISTGHGTPLWLAPRTKNGITVQQGTSHLNLSAEEVELLITGLRQMQEALAVTA